MKEGRGVDRAELTDERSKRRESVEGRQRLGRRVFGQKRRRHGGWVEHISLDEWDRKRLRRGSKQLVAKIPERYIAKEHEQEGGEADRTFVPG